MTTLPAKIARLMELEDKARLGSSSASLSFHASMPLAISVIREQQARYDALLAVTTKLRCYAGHDHDCAVNAAFGIAIPRCSCGYRKAIAALDALVEEGKDAK